MPRNTRPLRAVILILLFALTAAAPLAAQLGPGLYARFETNRGNMIFRLYYDRTPLTVASFVGLAEGRLPEDGDGQPWYNGLTFYRDIQGYAIFTGDPEGDGTGSPGYTFPRERGSLISAGQPGTLVMSGLATESHGSIVFIMKGSDAYLDNVYTPFGSLVEGERVLGRLREDDVVNRVTILRRGPEAEAFMTGPGQFRQRLVEARQAEVARLAQSDPRLGATIEALGDDYRKTPSGIFYRIWVPGTGDQPRPGNEVRVHYIGSLVNGQVFDSSRDRNQPFEFVLGQDPVISAWVETMMAMQTGERRTIIVPPELGYGSTGFGPIPPNSWLVFDVELLDFR